MSQLVSMEEAAAELEIPIQRFRQLVVFGEIPSQLHNGRPHIHVDTIRNLLLPSPPDLPRAPENG